MDIEGTKINLIEITKDYTPLIVEWRNKQNIRKNFIFQDDFTSEIHNKWIDENVLKGKAVQYIIIEKSTRKPIGCVFLKNINFDYKIAEFGIFIGEDLARGKGYGTEATKIICSYGFSLGMEKIILRVLSTNKTALESYKKAGFEMEGILKDEVNKDGEFIDLIIMSVKK